MELFHLIFLFVLAKDYVWADSETYLNKFAVHIEGGERVAREVADTHGFINLGQIGTLTDHYLFEHPHVHRRSAELSQDHHERLSSHPQVRSVQQQKLLSRKKRDFLEEPADFWHHREPASLLNHREPEIRSIKRETIEADKMFFNDALYRKMWYYHQGGIDKTDMNVQGAWKKGVTGKGVVITILDDGIEKIHDDLKDNYTQILSSAIWRLNTALKFLSRLEEIGDFIPLNQDLLAIFKE